MAVSARQRESGEQEEIRWDELEKVILEECDDVDGEGGSGRKNMEAGNPILTNGHSVFSKSPSSEEGIGTTRSSDPLSGAVDPKRHTSLHTRSSSAPSHSWAVTQHIFFTCRELILTERRYLSRLSSLVHDETASPPPRLMLQYAEELVHVSKGLLKAMEKEPSVRGVATAFLGMQKELEQIYVKWCGAVGDWFAGDGSPGKEDVPLLGGGVELSEKAIGRGRSQSSIKKGRMRHKSDGDYNGYGSRGDREESTTSSLKRTVSTWRTTVPSMTSIGFEVGSISGIGARKRDKDKGFDIEKEDEQVENKTLRKPTIRDLAILPTQRLMWYGMQFQRLCFPFFLLYHLVSCKLQESCRTCLLRPLPVPSLNRRPKAHAVLLKYAIMHRATPHSLSLLHTLACFTLQAGIAVDKQYSGLLEYRRHFLSWVNLLLACCRRLLLWGQICLAQPSFRHFLQMYHLLVPRSVIKSWEVPNRALAAFQILSCYWGGGKAVGFHRQHNQLLKTFKAKHPSSPMNCDMVFMSPMHTMLLILSNVSSLLCPVYHDSICISSDIEFVLQNKNHSYYLFQ